MANVTKFARSDCGHVCAHFERAKDKNGEYIKFGNQNIDTSRSHLNYNLGPDRESQYGFIKQRTGEVRCLARSDVKVMCSWVVTAPKGLAPDEHERFFRTAYQALAGKYGEQNVVSAWVHMDEKQPHMHFAFVPVVHDQKRNQDKVSAKDCITRTELQKFHPWLNDIMQREFGRDIGIETGETGTRGNLTMAQYKAVQEANERATEARQAVEELTQEKEQLQAEMQPYRDLQTSAEQIERSGINLGFGVLLGKEDARAYKEQAKAYQANRDEIETTRERSAALDQREKDLDKRKLDLDQRAEQLDQREDRDRNVHQLLEKSERENREKSKLIAKLQAKVATLQAKLEQAEQTISTQLENLRNSVRAPLMALTNVIKATGLLKYDKDPDGYAVDDLTKKQDQLLDGVAEYGADLARMAGHEDLAEDIDQHVGLSDDLKPYVAPELQHEEQQQAPQQLDMDEWDLG